ncbi:hypothetical protein D3C85_1492490 [compost metagenome]
MLQLMTLLPCLVKGFRGISKGLATGLGMNSCSSTSLCPLRIESGYKLILVR